jgi:spore coat protein U-like protein
MHGRLSGGALLLALALAAAPARAGCQASVSLVDFGALDLRRGGTLTGALSVACDGAQAFAVTASAGYGSFAQRAMRGPDGHVLYYNLFVDPGRRLVWGDGVAGGTTVIHGLSDGRRPVSIPVYAQVPPGQIVLAGAYSDAVVVATRP